MVDIHSHVLPGVDDGARTIDDSIAMLTAAADAGTTDIVATSHANTEYTWKLEVVEAKIKEVRQAIGNRIQVHPGCELHLTFDNINDAIANPTKYTINHGQWLLIEFSDLVIFQNSSQILARIRESRMLPIIAHPERNQVLQYRFETLEEWVKDGAFLQLTAHSLLGTFGSSVRKFSERLIEKGMCHFVASDAHDVEYRSPRLNAAFDWLTSRYGEPFAQMVTTENPAATLQGGYVTQFCLPKKRKLFGLWS